MWVPQWILQYFYSLCLNSLGQVSEGLKLIYINMHTSMQGIQIFTRNGIILYLPSIIYSNYRCSFVDAFDLQLGDVLVAGKYSEPSNQLLRGV